MKLVRKAFFDVVMLTGAVLTAKAENEILVELYLRNVKKDFDQVSYPARA